MPPWDVSYPFTARQRRVGACLLQNFGCASAALFLLCLLALCLPLTAPAQPALVWHQIAGGGTTSPGTGCQLLGTIGQSEASGGGGSLTAGFWNMFSGGKFDEQPFSPGPVAQVDTVTRTAGLVLRIFWSDLATNWSDADNDPVTLAGLNLVSTNGVDLLTNNTQIYYPASASNVNDQISYTITDGQGDTNTGYINILINPFVTGQQSPAISVGDRTITATFYGLPGLMYEVQRSTNLTAGAGWVNISTNTAGSNLQMQVVDDFADLGGGTPLNAYYRLKWQP